MRFLSGDLRLAARLALRTRGPSAIAVVALAFGIGLTTMMWSIVHGVVLRGLPFDRAERILHLERNDLARGEESLEVPIHDYLDWRERQRSFEDLAAFYTGTVSLSGPDGAERLSGAYITANFLDLLRVRPAVGRGIRAGEDRPGRETVALLGHRLWRDRFASDPSIVGGAIRLNGRPATVVGVMPEGFAFPFNEQVWLPLDLDPARLRRGEGQTLEVFGRLRDGVGREGAAAEMQAIAQALAGEHREVNDGVGAVVKPWVDEYIGAEPIALLWAMLAAVFCVLLIACVNVASLLLARAARRAKEVGIRSALGAPRWRLATQFLAEALVLALAGTVLGLVVARVGVALFNRAIEPGQPPTWIDIRVDPAALFFAAGAMLLATLAAGAIPAWQSARTDVNAILKDEGRGASSFRLGRVTRALVIAEIALSCALLAAAGLMIKSVVRLRAFDVGVPTEDVLTARVGLPEATYPDAEQQQQFWEDLLPRLKELPGATAATLASALPGLYAEGFSVAVEGKAYATPRDRPVVATVIVTPGFFETFEVRPVAGRLLEEGDRQGAVPVAVANRSFVRAHLGGGDPIGRRLRIGDEADEPWRTIIGVVPDLYAQGLENEEPEALYVPLPQSEARFLSLVVRGRGQPTALGPDVRRAVAAVDTDVPLYWMDTLHESIANENWYYGVFGALFAIFGAVALFLSAVGLYGITSLAVSQRTREVGVRMALGAEGRDVLRLLLRQGLVQLGIGLALGLFGAVVLTSFLRIVLFGVSPRDPAVLAGIVLVLAAASALAWLAPARRATRVDPVEALRYE